MARNMCRPVQLRCNSNTPAAVAAAAVLGVFAANLVLAQDLSLDADIDTFSASSQQTGAAERGTDDTRRFLIPALEIPTFELLLNRADHLHDAATYPFPTKNLSTNLHRSWVVDDDKFSTNQFLHPYAGSMYQGFTRSAGLSFWQASAYTFAGSLIWEEAGENTAPSINDQVATGIGGNFLGEPLFRIASLLLERDSDDPGWLRELAAGIVSPPTALNRLLFGDRFTPLFPSNDPAVFTSQKVTVNAYTHYTSDVNINADPSAPPSNQTLQRAKADTSFTM